MTTNFTLHLTESREEGIVLTSPYQYDAHTPYTHLKVHCDTKIPLLSSMKIPEENGPHRSNVIPLMVTFSALKMAKLLYWSSL